MKKLAVTLCLLLVIAAALSPVCYAAGDNAEAYLYCLEDGMPKYWLDLTGREAADPVLHCYFRSSDPTFYESHFLLGLSDADVGEDSVSFHTVYDAHGFDHSDWFKALSVRLKGEGLVLEVERDERTLAGGTEDNVLSGSYAMEPVGVRTRYEYRQEDGMIKYWLDLSEKAIKLHAMFRSGEPEYHEEIFTIDPATAKMEDAYTLAVGKLFNEKGIDVSGWFKSLKLTEVQGALLMAVERDERTLAGGTDDNILSGSYLFEPHNDLRPAHEGPYTPQELCRWAQIRYFAETGFFPPEAEFEKNDDGSYTVHLYEIVETDGVSHTATSAWYTLDEYGEGEDDILGTPVSLFS